MLSELNRKRCLCWQKSCHGSSAILCLFCLSPPLGLCSGWSGNKHTYSLESDTAYIISCPFDCQGHGGSWVNHTRIWVTEDTEGGEKGVGDRRGKGPHLCQECWERRIEHNTANCFIYPTYENTWIYWQYFSCTFFLALLKSGHFSTMGLTTRPDG